LQKFDLRLFVDAQTDADTICDQMLAIFGRWRLEEGEEIMDLADYAHVEEGPGVLLVSHRWQFGVDWLSGRPSIFYATRKNLSGSLSGRLSQALGGLVEKSQRLLQEEELKGQIIPSPGELEIVVNDRLQFPNTEAGDGQMRPAVEEVLDRLYGDGRWEIEAQDDPGERLGYRIRAGSEPPTLETMAGRL
jgi:hypothetical protein